MLMKSKELVGSKHQSYYTYDSLNRLSSASYKIPNKSLEESFTYDKAGNRLSKTSNSIVEKYKYNAKNQLIELEKATGTIQFSYDNEGNLTKEYHPEGITSYNYNAFNQTIKAETKEGNTLVSRYDAEGLRVEIEENERLTRFIFNKENIIAELDKDNNVIVRLTKGHEVVGSEIEETRFYYHQEEQGSTAYITNEQEEIENSYFYDAFGVLLEETQNIPNRITYTGQQYDSITQQYYLRARNYNPVIGRFTQEDVYRGDGLNLYDYCHSNPVIYYDPSGYAYCGTKKSSFGNKRTYNNYKELRKQGFSAEEAYGYMKKAKNAQSNIQKDLLGEGLMDDIMKNKERYRKLPSHVEGNHGIDGIYIRRGANGNISDVVIGEAKFGSSRLNKKTSMGKQMSDDWILANIEKMKRSKDKDTRQAAKDLLSFLKNGGVYDKQLFRIKKSGYFKRNKL